MTDQCGCDESLALRAEVEAIGMAIRDHADDLLGLQIPGADPRDMLNAMSKAAHDYRIEAANLEAEVKRMQEPETDRWWQAFCAVLGREGTLEFAATMASAAIVEAKKRNRL